MIRGASGAEHDQRYARTNGFTGSVAFSASGLPSGVTASLQPDLHDGHQQRADAHRVDDRDPGPATVTVTGTGGTLTRTTTIALTVADAPTPDFTLVRQPRQPDGEPGRQRDEHDHHHAHGRLHRRGGPQRHRPAQRRDGDLQPGARPPAPAAS